MRRAAGPSLRGHKTYSQLCGRFFDSRAECRRGEELALMQKAGEIRDLVYQVNIPLCDKPKVTITVDFCYSVYSSTQGWQRLYEDYKGVMTREFRVKLAWLKQKYGIDVILTSG